MELHDLHGSLMLEEAECWDRLASKQVGRLAVVVGGRPLIFPVNYTVAAKQVVVHTNPGTKLEAALRGPVAFEADEIHEDQRWGWSVVVQGESEEITDYDESAVRALALLPLDPYAGEKSRVMRIVPSHVSGREVGKRPE